MLNGSGVQFGFESDRGSSQQAGFGVLGGGSAQEEPGGNRQIEVGARVRF